MQINKPSTRVGLISSNNSLDKTTQRFVSDESEDGHCKILSSAVKSLSSEVENALQSTPVRAQHDLTINVHYSRKHFGHQNVPSHRLSNASVQHSDDEV